MEYRNLLQMGKRACRSRQLGVLLALSAAAVLTAACTHKVRVSRATQPAVATPAVAVGARQDAAGPLVCLDSLHAYRFNGKLAFNAGSGPEATQLGSLANLLGDVSFDGASVGAGGAGSAGATMLNVHFGGSGPSQDLQEIRVGGTEYDRADQGAWQESTGQGPILGTLSRIDPATLCQQTLSRIDFAKALPIADTLQGQKTLHYSFGPDTLAQAPGILGRATSEGGAGANTHLDVWTLQPQGYPVRIMLNSEPQQGENGGSFAVSLDVTDLNGSDINIKAPQ